MTDDQSLIHGTLDLLVLRVLAWGQNHGYGIAKWIRAGSTERLIVEDRALYLSLHRLEARGWIASAWGLSAANRKAKFYRLTVAGKKQLRERIERWTDYVDAVSQIIACEEAEPT